MALTGVLFALNLWNSEKKSEFYDGGSARDKRMDERNIHQCGITYMSAHLWNRHPVSSVSREFYRWGYGDHTVII